MGTSQSSSGSPSGVPMVPPWVPDIESEEDDSAEVGKGSDSEDPENGQTDKNDQGQEDQNEIAPSARFAGARRNLNSYSKHGDSSSMKKGVGYYIANGYGGSKSAVRRFGGTVSTGGVLYSVLSKTSSGQTVEGFDVNDLSDKSSTQIVDRLIEVIRPIDGTQDTEASRNAIQTAFSELLAKDENINLLNLTEEDRLFVTERFVADDVFRRLELDVGKDIHANAPNITSAFSRLREIKNYIRQTVASSFRKIKNSGNRISSTSIRSTIKKILSDAFTVFEDYLQ